MSQWPFALVLGVAGLVLMLALGLPGLVVALPFIGLTRLLGICYPNRDVPDMCFFPDALYWAALWPMGLLCCPCIAVFGAVVDFSD